MEEFCNNSFLSYNSYWHSPFHAFERTTELYAIYLLQWSDVETNAKASQGT